MRRLLPIVCAVVFADTMLFAAVIPLVPTLADDYGLSKLEAGVLVGTYGAGAMLSGIPAGLLAGRIGPKRTVILGLLTLAVSSALFGLAGGPLSLALSRFAQGISSAVTWAGALAWLTLGTPRERRGQILGTAFSFAVLGFIVGPAVGAVAELTTIMVVFVTIAIVIAGLTLVASACPAGPDESMPTGGLLRALGDHAFVAAIWLTMLPALFFGAIDVLVPLALDDAGWGSVAIAATFVCAGAIEVAVAPAAGAISDRQGRMYPVRMALWAFVAVALALALTPTALLVATLVVCAAVVASLIYTPSIALVSDRAEARGIPQTLGFGVMNTAWALGVMVGPAGGGALASALGDAAPFVVTAALAAATAIVVVRPRRLARAA